MENVEGTKALLRRLDAVGKAPNQMLEDWQIATVIEAKQRHRPNRKTGMTSASIQVGGITRDHAEVEAGGAAVFLEFGTKPHTIRPRRASMLAWAPNARDRRLSGAARSGTSTGNLVFARVVHHPGTKPYPFLIPGAKAALDQIDWPREVTRRWNKAG